jgi:hypothetical protein
MASNRATSSSAVAVDADALRRCELDRSNMNRTIGDLDRSLKDALTRLASSTTTTTSAPIIATTQPQRNAVGQQETIDSLEREVASLKRKMNKKCPPTLASGPTVDDEANADGVVAAAARREPGMHVRGAYSK